MTTTRSIHTIRMELCPTWAHLDDVRLFIERFCRDLPRERAEAVAMAALELLQNAVSNSLDGKSVVSLRIDLAADEVELVVENLAHAEHLGRLEEMKLMLERHDDAQALFLELMRRSAGKAGSGLGLGRIRYEGQMHVGIEVQGELVRVRATGRASTAPLTKWRQSSD